MNHEIKNTKEEIKQEIVKFLTSNNDEKTNLSDSVEAILINKKNLSTIFNYYVHYSWDAYGKNAVGVDVYLQEKEGDEFMLTSFIVIKSLISFN
jgi:hypothetical protein